MKRLILLLLISIVAFITTPVELEASEATNDTGPELVVSIDQADFEGIDQPPGIEGKVDKICQTEIYKDPPGKLAEGNLIFTKENAVSFHYYKLAGTERLCNSDLRIDNYTKPKVIHPSDIRIRNDGKLTIT